MNIRTVKGKVLIVGSGTAAYGAGLSLLEQGFQDLHLLTEGRLKGTSRNTGSDKQTYYKLSLAGSEPDSVRKMADVLYSGGLVDGDHALSEASFSPKAFYRLVHLGVPFPSNAYGEYVGYKTDHDPNERGTSVGPYTSREMTEKLEAAFLADPAVTFRDEMLAIKIFQKDEAVTGVLALDLGALEEPDQRLVYFQADAVVWATGGPACLYRDSVFPGSQHGGSGVAFGSGCWGKNLTEWQYGLASVKPRWNVSGTYMQALPRFVSVGPDGDEVEFLAEAFDLSEMLGLVFLKGYQWPFDVRRAMEGSSQIDLKVHEETQKGRRVYLDFRTNPLGLEELDFAGLPSEAREYLEATGACFGRPIDRLAHMNQPAIDFYLDHGVDLAKDRLEIALCAQHNNGGLEVDENWMTTLRGLYAVGEVAGTHGVYRPGGSALNAGQVGGIKVARALRAVRPQASPSVDDLALDLSAVADQVERVLGHEGAPDYVPTLRRLQGLMSDVAGPIRDLSGMKDLLAEVLEAQASPFAVKSVHALPGYFRFLDTLEAMKVYLTAFIAYAEAGGKSRGSALYMGGGNEVIEQIQLVNGSGEVRYRDPRPMPGEAPAFETVWREDRQLREEEACNLSETWLS